MRRGGRGGVTSGGVPGATGGNRRSGDAVAGMGIVAGGGFPCWPMAVRGVGQGLVAVVVRRGGGVRMAGMTGRAVRHAMGMRHRRAFLRMVVMGMGRICGAWLRGRRLCRVPAVCAGRGLEHGGRMVGVRAMIRILWCGRERGRQHREQQDRHRVAAHAASSTRTSRIMPASMW